MEVTGSGGEDSGSDGDQAGAGGYQWKKKRGPCPSSFFGENQCVLRSTYSTLSTCLASFNGPEQMVRLQPYKCRPRNVDIFMSYLNYGLFL